MWYINLINTIIISRQTRLKLNSGKVAFGEEPRQGWWLRYTSLKLFWSQPIAPRKTDCIKEWTQTKGIWEKEPNANIWTQEGG